MAIRYAMNRTCAPQLNLTEFAQLAAAVGVNAVEIRNDIENREFMDGTLPGDVKQVLIEFGLEVASVNALQRFNEWNPTRQDEAQSLMAYAARLGAPGVVLCPVHHADHGWSESECERNLRNGLRELRPILADLGVKGYVEPLGMTGSTMKKQSMAVEAIADVDGWDVYELCFDTFQFFRCGDTKLYPQHIGLAHMSGIQRTDLPPNSLTEPDRVLIDISDRVENVGQLRQLLAKGYQGYVSMEPFNVAVQQSVDLRKRLMTSFAFVESSLKATVP